MTSEPPQDRLPARLQRYSAGVVDAYGLVLILLIATFLMITGGTSQVWRVLLVPTVAATVLETYSASNVTPRTMKSVALLVVPMSFVALVAVIADGEFVSPWVIAPLVLTMVTGPVVILRRILSHGTVTASTILGAICAYVYIGIIFAFVFGFVDAVQGDPFFAQGPTSRPGQFTYFSFVTVTTLGYGDLTPGTDLAQSLAVLEALTGSIYLVTLVARLVSMYGRGDRR